MDFTPYLSAGIMLLGILVGTLISPKVQHKISGEYSRKDLIFQRKLKYFEYVVETIEKNKKLYSNLIFKIENSRKKFQVTEIIDELKNERKRFSVMSSSLYFNPKNLSEKIVHFVKIEKDIFNEISRLTGADKKIKEEIIEHLTEHIKRLNKKGGEILYEMKRELAR